MALNSLLNIQVRVMARQAQAQLATIDKQVRTMEASTRAAGATTSRAAGIGAASMIKWGSQTQWAGRQLIYNFTLPLGIAAGAATKFAIDNEKAMVRVRKVYGDTSMSARQVRNETNALAKSFRVLSDEFGVNQAQTINVAADWAAAGASGLALAKSTKLTLQTMILGELDAATATKALIAIQAQYGMNTEQLSKTIDTLNMVENQTGTSMKDLIDVMARSAGSARSAGVDVLHLAAYTAALVPAAGSASSAGNALKTIFSRILSPTKQAADAMKQMGIDTQSVNWESLTAVGRIDVLAKKYKQLSGAQKVQISTLIGGRYQLNRFDVLMRQVGSTNSYYAKTLKSASDAGANYIQKQKELNQVLRSQPQQFKQIGVQLENLGAQIIGPLIPLFIAVAASVRKMVEWFTTIDPRVQRLVITFLALIAVFGPILRLLGAMMVLVGYFGKAVKELVKVLFSAVVVFAKFFSLIGKGIALLMTPFKALFTFLGTAFSGLVGIVRTAAAEILAVFIFLGKGVFQAIAFMWAQVLRLTLLGLGLVVKAVFSALSDIVAAVVVQGGRSVVAAFAGMFKSIVVTAGTVLLDGLTALAGPLFRVMGAITAGLNEIVIVGGTLLARAWAAWQGVLVTLSSGFGTIILRMWGAIEAALIAVTNAFGAIWARVWYAVTTAITTITTTVGALLPKIWAAVMVAVQTVTAVIGRGIMAIWTSVIEFMASGRLYSFILGAATKFGTGLMAIFGALRTGLVAIIMSPWTLAIAGIVALVVGFRDQIARIWNTISTNFTNAFKDVPRFFDDVIKSIIRAFDALPQSVQNAVKWVVRVVANAAKQVYQWFSYLNPFAHHSPSLVENTTKGMAAVRDQHKRTTAHAQKHAAAIASAHSTITQSMSSANAQVSGISGSNDVAAAINQQTKVVSSADTTIQKVLGDLQKFKAAARGLIPSQWADEIKDIKKEMPSLLPMFQNMLGDLRQLNDQLRKQHAAVAAQQQVVNQWQQKLNAANKELDKQSNLLSKEQDHLSKLKDQYSAAQSKMSDFANAPIKGMQKFSDKIFANQEAQKKLQLQMDLWEKKNGSLDDLNNKLQTIQGTISDLQGQAAALRAKGAGSDVLGPIEDQIKALQKQAGATQKTIDNSPVDKLNKQMEKLQQNGEILQLQNDIKFDPLEHQISKLANTQKELSYKQIIEGIKAAKKRMEELSPKIADQTDKVNRQQKVVDQLTKKRDADQRSLDREQKKLDKLTKAYDKTKAAISKVTNGLQSISSAASQAATSMGKAAGAGKSLSETAKAFKAAGGGDFPGVGGNAKLGREGSLKDQSKAIDRWTKREQQHLANSLGKMDMFGPLKDMWNKFTAWMSKNLGPVMHAIGQLIGAVAKGIGKFLASSGAQKAGDFIVKVFHAIGTAIGVIWRLLKPFIPDVVKLFKILGNAAMQIWHELVPALVRLAKVLGPVIGAIVTVWLAQMKAMVNFVLDVLGPALHVIIAVVSDVINIVADFLKFFEDLFTGHITAALKDIGKLFYDTFHGIWDLIKGVAQVIWGIIKGVIDAIVGFFKYLYDVLVGHSIIPDLVHEIVKWFNWLIKPIKLAMELIWKGIKAAWDLIVKVFRGVWDWLRTTFQGLWNGVKAIVLNPIQAAHTALITLWNAIKDIFTGAWNWIRGTFRAIWNGVKDIFTGPFNAAKSVIETIFRGLWHGISGAVKSFKSAFETAWNALKTIFAAPIKFLIDTVIDGGILGAWNWLAGHIPGMGGLKVTPWHPVIGGYRFAEGGVLPGFAPGHDRIHAMLSPGEAVLVPEVVKMLGADQINRWNKLGVGQRHGGSKQSFSNGGIARFAGGGILDAINPAHWIKKFYDKIKSFVTKFTDKIEGNTAFGNALEKVPGELIKKAGSSVWNWLKSLPGKLISKAWGAISRFFHLGPVLGIEEGGSRNRSVNAAIQMGRSMALQNYGWSGIQWGALERLWLNESGWRWNATNPTSGAYGIPQALPPNKMASAGRLWRTDPFVQIKWGLNYIKQRYGDPYNALSMWNARNPHWYANGTAFHPGGSAILGDRGPELVNLPRGSRVFDSAATIELISRLADKAYQRSRARQRYDGNLSRSTTVYNTHNENKRVDMHFASGAFSFPNIKSSDDAEELIRNLESLAEGSL